MSYSINPESDMTTSDAPSVDEEWNVVENNAGGEADTPNLDKDKDNKEEEDIYDAPIEPGDIYDIVYDDDETSIYSKLSPKKTLLTFKNICLAVFFTVCLVKIYDYLTLDCSSMYLKYQDSLDNCIANYYNTKSSSSASNSKSTKNPDICLINYIGEISKYEDFCNWDLSLILDLQKSHIKYLKTQILIGTTADKLYSSVKYLQTDIFLPVSKFLYDSTKSANKKVLVPCLNSTKATYFNCWHYLKNSTYKTTHELSKNMLNLIEYLWEKQKPINDKISNVSVMLFNKLKDPYNQKYYMDKVQNATVQLVDNTQAGLVSFYNKIISYFSENTK